MAAQMPRLHTDRQVTVSIKTKDWSPAALPNVGFQLQIGANVFVVGMAPANSDGQTVTVTLQIPQIHGAGNGPWPSALKIAYCAVMLPSGHFDPPQVTPPAPLAVGEVGIAGRSPGY